MTTKIKIKLIKQTSTNVQPELITVTVEWLTVITITVLSLVCVKKATLVKDYFVSP